jgi:hypothetical protein
MAMYVLDKAYKVATSAGVGANRVVVQGAADGECDQIGRASCRERVYRLV